MQSKDIWDDLELRWHGESLEEEMFEFLSAYADGECSPKERRLVEAYLAESAEGRELLADLRRASCLLLENAEEAPEWLRPSILSRTVRRRRLMVWRLAAGFATSAAAAAMLVFALTPSKQHETRPGKPLLAELNAKTISPKPPSRTHSQAPSMSRSDNTHDEPPKVRTAPEVLQASYTPKDTPQFDSGPVPAPARIIPKPPETQPVEYAPSDYSKSQKAEPTAPDVVSLTAERPDESNAAGTPKPVTRNDGGVLPDAREKLRDKLKRLNQENKDIKEAVGTK